MPSNAYDQTMETGNFPRSWRGYRRSDVDVSIARSALRVEQLEFELEGMTQRANAMQIEIRQLHARVDELRERESSLAKSLDEVRERREHMDRESALRARQVLLEAEERASSLKSDGLRKVGELQQQVEQLLGMRSGLTQALQRLSEDIAGAMARIAAAPATAIDRPVEDQVARWSEERLPGE
jgi:chromosome segregation ATPase